MKVNYFHVYLTLNLLFIFFDDVKCANILAIFPGVWKSHYIFGTAILKRLVSQGHAVTVISAHSGFKSDPVNDNNEFIEIFLKGIPENWIDIGLSFKFDDIKQISALERFTKMVYASTSNVDLILGNRKIQALIKSGEKFDLLIGDFFLGDAFLGFANHFKCPTVILSPTGINKWLNEITGNPHSSAYNPSSFLPFLEDMSLGERIQNTLMSAFEKFSYSFFRFMYQDRFYQKYFRQYKGQQLPSLINLVKNVSLVLLNSNPITQYPNALMPNMIEVGGAHLYQHQDKSGKKIPQLSKDILDFIEESPGDIIYISFGANLRTCDLPKEKLDALMKAINMFEPMTVRIILRWEKFEFPNKPANVFVKYWLPQQEILAHPKVKVFITSGGLMSTMEAIYSKTLLLGIPIFPQQEVNMKRIEKLVCGLKLDYESLTATNLYWKIQELLTNTTYSNNLLKISDNFKMIPNNPLDLSIYYIEMILKTNGAVHLKSIVNNQLNFIQTELIDVITIILLGIFIIIAVPSIIICIILRKSNNNLNKMNNNSIQFADSNGELIMKKLMEKKYLEGNKYKDRKKKSL